MLSRIPPVVKNLIILNVFFYIATFYIFPQWDLIRWLSVFYPESEYFHPYQFITYMFMHGGFWHIALNMLALWMFGSEIEMYWGKGKFLGYYIVCGLGAAILNCIVTYMQLYVFKVHGPVYINAPMLGASGAIYGILLAYGMMFPNRELLMLFFPVPIKAKYMVFIWAGLELLSGGFGAGDGIAHFAHLGGMLTGFIVILIWKAQGRFYS